MKTAAWNIIGGSAGVLVLGTLLFLWTVYRYGFSRYGIKEYPVPDQNEYSSWNEVFADGCEMSLISMNTGLSVAAPGFRPYLDSASFPEGYSIDTEATAPVCIFAVRHPERGDILFDAGLNRSTYENPPFGDQPLMLNLYQRATKTRYTQNPGESAGAVLEREDVDPRVVLMTHMHPDHAAGLTETGNDVPVVFGMRENTFYYRALIGKYLSGKTEISTLDFDQGVSIPPFGRVINVFGDASVWAISSPGHTADHISYLINIKDSPVLIVGDLVISESCREQGIRIGTDYGKKGREDLDISLEEFTAFKEMYPFVTVYTSHSDGAF
jgi:glyoxylase-like metal-dependent hydrolase (beta-lactamase superfamily II)